MSAQPSYRIPNSIIAARVVLALVACGLLVTGSPAAAAVGVVLTAVAIGMDALDGIVARRMGLASKLGGILDITADRIVEHVFWITFAVTQSIPLWVPLVIVTRSFVVDAVRGLALVQGRTAFGESSLARSPVTHFLTSSRSMRSLYGVAKVVAFVLLGVLIAAGDSVTSQGLRTVMESAAMASVLAAVALCLIRGIPVILDAAAYLQAEPAVAGGGASS